MVRYSGLTFPSPTLKMGTHHKCLLT
ncbi:hypothetical protein V12B01_13760 [Vibrio splendidus 12B01]|nr:hypothetical protein V12B01_13760 [Vibrio splendidus 12B01]